jgi:hypothetical protein
MPKQPPSLRDQKILDFRKKNPCLPLRVIGDHYGISKQRIDQIIRRNNLKIEKPKRYCAQCNSVLPSRLSKYCSRECLSDSRRIAVQCEECGKIFFRRTVEVVRRIGEKGYSHIHCSYKCHGTWAGRTVGFGPQRALKQRNEKIRSNS